jgi:glycine cleavage system regulatory protein
MPDPMTIAALIGGGSMIAAPLISRLVEGSPEDQIRSQFKVQQELEGKANSQDQELQNLMSSGVSPSISELIGENNLMKQVEEASYKLKRARSRRPQYLEELGDILEGQHARIAALQSERTPSALEIIQMMEGIGG